MTLTCKKVSGDRIDFEYLLYRKKGLERPFFRFAGMIIK